MTEEKTASTVYISHESASYGIFCFNEEGDLFLNSDWGMYGFAWRHYGPGTFRAFLAQTNADYVLGKFELNQRSTCGKKINKNSAENLTILITEFISFLNKN